MTLSDTIETAAQTAADSFDWKQAAPPGTVLNAAVSGALPQGDAMVALLGKIVADDQAAVVGVVSDYMRKQVRDKAAAKVLASAQKALG